MTTRPEDSAYRYDAFISYRHVEPDRGWAKWLHGALETYRVPRELVAKGLPKRLTRIFRDEEELPANADLSTQITAALDESKFLIVICSPRAPHSKWVNAEVEHFRKLGRHDRILALLIEGEPRDSFPAALTAIRRNIVDAATGQTREEIEEIEPLAADVRPERSDVKAHTLRSHARLRLLACILGCRFDDLRQREAERRAQRMKQIGSGLAALVLVMAGLTAYAFAQRNEANVQRANAETQTGIAKANAEAAQKQKEAAEKARAEEKARADELKQVSDFQSQMLSQIDTTEAGIDLMADVRERFAAALEKAGVPEEDRTKRLDAFRQELVRVNATDTAAAMIDRTILTPAIKTIDEKFKDDPRTDASLRQALSDVYAAIGLFERAIPLQTRALEMARAVYGADDERTLESLNKMGHVWFDQGDYSQAEACWNEALTRSRARLGPRHPTALSAFGNLGAVLEAQGKLTEAEPYFREALRLQLESEGPKTLASLRAMGNLGFLLHSQGRFAEAEEYQREAAEQARRTLGDDVPETLQFVNNLAQLLKSQGRLNEAIDLHKEILERRRRVLGEAHPKTLESIGNLGSGLHEARRLPEAEPYLREAVEVGKRALGEDHPFMLPFINNLAALLEDLGRLDEAESLHRAVLEQSRRVLPSGHPHISYPLNNLAFVLQLRGRADEALPLYQEALALRQQSLGDDHAATLTSVNNMGYVLQALGRLDEAEPHYRKALAGRRRVLGEQHPDSLASISNLGGVIVAQRRYQEAIALLAPAAAAARGASTGSNAPRLAGLLTALARARIGLAFDADRFALAESNLLEAYPIYLAAKDRGPTHKGTIACVLALVDLYTAWDKAEPGKGYDAKAAEWKAKLPAPEPGKDPPEEK